MPIIAAQLFDRKLWVEAQEFTRVSSELDRLRVVVRSLIDDLPAKRDWLNPDIERELRESVSASGDGHA